MERIICSLFVLIFSATVLGQREYRLVWSDEFDVDGRPSKDWTFERGFVRNQELQWYQAENTYVKDGCLVIEGRREHRKNPNYEAGSNDWRMNREFIEYTSSSLTTRLSQQFVYGRYEVCAKIPVASGSWPAIWLLGNKWEWPQNGEIDMMEYYIKDGQPSILANACWSSAERWQAVWDSVVTPFSHFTEKDLAWADKFHIWRMDWDKDFIRLYLDDELLNEIDLSKTINGGYNGNVENPFSNNVPGFKHYLLLNLALGSNGGEPDIAQFPLRYYIDYVRVYQ
jgi:beta-glucanase (GH16 family)